MLRSLLESSRDLTNALRHGVKPDNILVPLVLFTFMLGSTLAAGYVHFMVVEQIEMNQAQLNSLEDEIRDQHISLNSLESTIDSNSIWIQRLVFSSRMNGSVSLNKIEDSPNGS